MINLQVLTNLTPNKVELLIYLIKLNEFSTDYLLIVTDSLKLCFSLNTLDKLLY